MEDDVYDEIDDDEDEDDDDNDDDKDESTTQSDESEAALEGKDISEDEHMVDLLDSKEYSSQADDAFQFHNLSDSEEEEMTLLDFGGDTTQAVARPKSAQAKFSIFEVWVLGRQSGMDKMDPIFGSYGKLTFTLRCFLYHIDKFVEFVPVYLVWTKLSIHGN